MEFKMKRKILTFNKTYFTIAILLFITEVIIALFVKDRFIRPYVGDYLVVILIFASIKSIFNIRALTLALGVLLFAYVIEFSQYFNLIGLLHLSADRLAQNVMGNSFSWSDMAAYTLGISTIIILKKWLCRQKTNKQL